MIFSCIALISNQNQLIRITYWEIDLPSLNNSCKKIQRDYSLNWIRGADRNLLSQSIVSLHARKVIIVNLICDNDSSELFLRPPSSWLGLCSSRESISKLFINDIWQITGGLTVIFSSKITIWIFKWWHMLNLFKCINSNSFVVQWRNKMPMQLFW